MLVFSWEFIVGWGGGKINMIISKELVDRIIFNFKFENLKAVLLLLMFKSIQFNMRSFSFKILDRRYVGVN